MEMIKESKTQKTDMSNSSASETLASRQNVIKFQITSALKNISSHHVSWMFTFFLRYQLFINKHVIKDIEGIYTIIMLLLIVFACYRHQHIFILSFFLLLLLLLFRETRVFKERETQHIFITTSNLIISIIDLSVYIYIYRRKNICNERTIIRVTLFNPSSHL